MVVRRAALGEAGGKEAEHIKEVTRTE